MDEEVIDFGNGVETKPNLESTSTMDTPDITGNNPKSTESDITNKDSNNSSVDVNNSQTEERKDENSSTEGLEAGTVVEFEGVEYTVAENGDIVDKDGKVFKAAGDVQAWLDENEQTDDNSLGDTSIHDIIDAVGIDVKDEDGNDIEFTNDKEGIKSYVDAIIELKTNEANHSAINKFYNDNPVVKQFVDYLIVNNGNPRGFGELPDRSGITVDKNNENQQEQIIRVAAAEFGNKSVTDAYIKYLKDCGGLYDEAVNQLVALQEKDEAMIKQIETDAARARQAEESALREYWENVNNVISSRSIAGYKIPEVFVKEENGQKISLTPNDFFDYLYKAREIDTNGNKITRYQKDLDELSDEELLNKELLDAWLMFTGGTYKDLIDMAIKEREVHKLIVKSRQNRSTRTIKINKPTGKVDINSIVLN